MRATMLRAAMERTGSAGVLHSLIKITGISPKGAPVRVTEIRE